MGDPKNIVSVPQSLDYMEFQRKGITNSHIEIGVCLSAHRLILHFIREMSKKFDL